MVQVVRSRPTDQDCPPHLGLRIRKSWNGTRVLASLDPNRIRVGEQWLPLTIRFGTPASEVYAIAVAEAASSDISLLWIDDPEGLFPTPSETQTTT